MMGRPAAAEVTYAEPGDPDPTDVPGSPEPSPTSGGKVTERAGGVRIADPPFLPGYYLG